MRFARSFPLVMTSLASFAIALAVSSCKEAQSPKSSKPPRSVEACEAACHDRAAASSRACSDQDCHRGCTFILDRLLENEGNNVLACVVASKDKCDDTLWGNCAVRIGEHADGGPPPPPPPDDD